MGEIRVLEFLFSFFCWSVHGPPLQATLKMLVRSAARHLGSRTNRAAAAFSTLLPNDPVIVSFARTPIASFQGEFASLTAPELGSIAVKGAIERAGIQPSDIQEAFLGNVVSTGIGQAPTRQVVLGAGIPNSVPCTGINKVCASGTKSVMIGAMSVMTGHQSVVLCGGFESMSNIPYHIPKARGGLRLGDSNIVDGLIKDGLWDPYGNTHMGICGERCSEEYSISREAQDDFALESYARAQAAWDSGTIAEEVVPVTVSGRGGDKVVSVDSEFSGLKVRAVRGGGWWVGSKQSWVNMKVARGK